MLLTRAFSPCHLLLDDEQPLHILQSIFQDQAFSFDDLLQLPQQLECRLTKVLLMSVHYSIALFLERDLTGRLVRFIISVTKYFVLNYSVLKKGGAL